MRTAHSVAGLFLLFLTLLSGCRSGVPEEVGQEGFASTPTPFSWGAFPPDLAPVSGWSLTGHTLYLDLYDAATARVEERISSRGPDDLDGDSIEEGEREETLRVDDPIISQVASDLLVQFYGTGTSMQFLPRDLIVRPIEGLFPQNPASLDLPQHGLSDSTVAEVKRFVLAVAQGGADPILYRELPWWQEQEPGGPLPEPQRPIYGPPWVDLKGELQDALRRERMFRDLEQDLMLTAIGIEVPLDSRDARSGSGLRTFDLVRDALVLQNVLGGDPPASSHQSGALALLPLEWEGRISNLYDNFSTFLRGEGEQCDSAIACEDCRRSPGGVQEFCGDSALQWWLGEQCDDGGTCLGGAEHGKICSPSAAPPSGPSARSTTAGLCRAGQGSCVPIGGDGCNEFCQLEGDYCGDATTLYDHDANSLTPKIGWEACDEGLECPNGGACTTYADCKIDGAALRSSSGRPGPGRVCINASSLIPCPNGDSDCPGAEPNSCRYVFDGVCTHNGKGCRIDAQCWGSAWGATSCVLDGACRDDSGFVLPVVSCINDSGCTGPGQWCQILLGYCSGNPAMTCTSNSDCSSCTSESVLGTCAVTGEECASDENCASGYCELDPSNICRPRDLDDGTRTCNQFCSSKLFCGDRITAIGEECDGGMRCRDGTPCARGEPCEDESECMSRPPPTGLGCGAKCKVQQCGDAERRTDGASQCSAMAPGSEDHRTCLALVEQCDTGRRCIDGTNCEKKPSVCLNKGRCAITGEFCTPSTGAPCKGIDNSCITDSSCEAWSGDWYDDCSDTCKQEFCGDGVTQGVCSNGVCSFAGGLGAPVLIACDSNNDCRTGGRLGEACDDGGFCGGVLGGERCTADWQCAEYKHCFGTTKACSSNSDCEGVSCVAATSGICSTVSQDGCAPDCSYVERCGDGVVQENPLGQGKEQCDEGSKCINGPDSPWTDAKGVLHAPGEDCSKDPTVCNCPPQLPGSPPSGCTPGVCASFMGRCTGELAGTECSKDADCYTVSCSSGVCVSGAESYGSCSSDADCNTASCEVSSCLNGCDSCREIDCGNGVLEAAGKNCREGTGDDEECDDGNKINGDGCSASCKVEKCGDGVVDPDGADNIPENGDDEACEPMMRCGGSLSGTPCTGQPSVCPVDKSCLPSCEPPCTLSCKIAPPCGDGCGIVCGDGKECDDGNTDNNDGCSSTCKIEFCGDGIVNGPSNALWSGEECDTGRSFCGGDPENTRCTKQSDCPPAEGPCIHLGNVGNEVCPTTGCTPSCRNAIDCPAPFPIPPPCVGGCGDGCRDPGEACDDSNTTPGDGCSSSCTIEYCGDGTVNAGRGYNPYWWWGWGWYGYWGGWGGSGWWVDPYWRGFWWLGGNPNWWGWKRWQYWHPWWWGGCYWGYCGWYGGIEQCDPGGRCWGGTTTCSFGAEGSQLYPNPCASTCPPGECTTMCVPDSAVAPIPGASTGYCTGCFEVKVGDCRADCNEECDDGNTGSCDGCSSEAKIEYCGDGLIQTKLGEQCDPGATCADGKTPCTLLGGPTPSTSPPPFPSPSSWPDGVVTACDDGSCGMRCSFGTSALGTLCGGGSPSPPPPGLLGCTPQCTFLLCGDKRIDCNEGCDDGNLVDGDGCSGATHPIGMCLREFCGDGYMDSDGPGNAPGMNGVDDDRDGSTDEWDELPSSLGVDDDGDELIDEADEHRLWGDDEQCDDGWKNSDVTADACRTDCSNPRCGDGVKDAGEQCDDGNAKDGDGCSSLCAREGCGDFVVQEELGEQCDFGGRKNGDPAASPCSIGDPGVGVSFSCLPVSLDGDSCDAKCQWEQSPLDPSRKERLCGNGVIDPGEQCDTSSMCVVGATPTTPCSSHADCSLGPCVLDQPGGDYVCAKDVVIHCDDGGLPDESLCARLCRPCTAACTFAVTLCGDGNADAGEECDDGNDVSGDGCTFCQLDRRDLCGNGVVDPGEQCDGGAIRTLECTSSCQLPHPPPVCGDGKVESNQTFADRMREILDLREGVLGERGFSLGYQLPGTGEEQPGWFVLPARPGGACSTPTEAAMSGLCRDAREEVSTSQCGNGVIDPGEECDDGRLGVVSFSRPKYNGFQWWRMLFGKTFILHSSTPFYEWYFKLLPYEPYNWQESLWHPWYWPYRTGAWGNWYKNWFYWSGSVPRLKDLLWTTPDQTACSQQCTLVRCGNGRIDLSEECDDPKSSLCSENCQLKNGDPTGGECGDGVINWWNDEECDNGGTCVLKFTTEAPSSSALPTVSFLDVACTTVSSCTCPSTIPGTRCKVVQSCAPRNFDGCDKNCEIESYGDEPDQEEDNYTDCGDGAVNPHDEECEPSGWCGGMIPEDDTNGSVYPNAVGCTKKNQAWICDPTINPVSKGSDCDFSKDEHCSTSCRILGSLVPSCGNGALEPWIGEGCDDGKHCLDHYGNNVNCSKSTSSCAVPSSCITIGGDGCNEACKNEKCGNGIQEMFEQCDFGLLNSDNLPSTCRGSCIFSSCGDMVTDWGEECDDGVTYTCIDGAACTPGSPCPDGSLCTDWGLDGCWFCLSTLCGNGILDFAESCDDGNRSDADDCSRWCLKKHPTDPKMGICGDGVVAGAEECDDGNIVSEDGCSGMDVKKENGDPYPCKVEKCGDGIVQEGLGEECDAGPKNSWSPDAPCRENCTLPRCGDIDPSSNKPIRDGKRGEGCDDGRQCLSGPHSGSLCFDDRDCLEDLGPCAIAPLAEQGRCTLDASRTCSDGDDCMREHPCDLRDGDGCSRACLIETGWKAMVGGGVEKSCGDGVIDPGDECDDGNTSSGDGCSKECLLEYPELCGDGVIDANISEQCDDSNAVSRDGCSATCQRELVRCRGDCADNDAFSCGGGKPCSDQTNRTCDQGTPSNPSDDTSCVFNPSCAFSCRIGFCGNGQIDAGEECDQGDSGDNVCTRFCEAVLASESGSVLRIDSSTSRGRVGVEEVMEAGRELLELQGGGPFGETRSVDNWSLYPFGSWRPWSRLARRPLDQDGGYPRWMGPHASPFPNTVGGHLRKIVQSFQSLRTTDVIPDRTPLFPLEPIGISSFSACQETRPVLTPVTEIPSSPSLTLPPVLPGQVVAEIERLLCSESGTPRMPFSFLCNRAEEQSRAFMLSSIPVMLGLTLQEEAETTKLRERILLQSEEIGAFLGGMAMQEFMGSVLSALSQQIQATTDLFKELGRIAFTTELCPFSGELCKP